MAFLSRLRCPLLLLHALILSVTASAADEGYPSRPIRLIVPFTPGASTDLVSRAFAEEAGKALGKPVVVDNRPGAGTAIGTQAVKQAPADGYTVLFGSGAMISIVLALKDPGYAMSDFTPVALLNSNVQVLMIPAALPVKNLEEFIAYAKANPDKMNYAMLGPGAASHVLAERFARSARFQWQDISYKGGMPAVQAVMSNDVQGYFSTETLATSFAKSDKVKLLATAAEERGEFLPDIPTFKESGIGDVVEQGWTALFVRSDTPKMIVEKLRKVFSGVMASTVMKEHLKRLGASPYKMSIEEFPMVLENELRTKREEARRLGIKPQ